MRRFAAARRPLVMLARVFGAAFFIATALYGLLAYSPFTNEQFIKPNVSAGLTAFAVWHGELYLLVLCVTALTMAADLDRPDVRWIGWSYLGASAALGGWLFMHPLWLQGDRPRTNLVLAFVAALWPVWLALFDHRALGPLPALEHPGESRVARSCAWTAAIVSALFAIVVPARLRSIGGFALPWDGVLLGAVAAAITLLTVFTIVWLVLMLGLAVAGLTRASARTEYRLLWVLSVAGVTLTLIHVVLDPIAIRGAIAWAIALSLAVSLASTWSALAHARAIGRGRPMSALDAWLAPITTTSSAVGSMIGVAAVCAGGFLIIGRVSTFDWEFMLQKLVAEAVWLAAFAFVHASVRDRPAGRFVWVSPLIVLALFGGEQVLVARVPTASGLAPEFVLDGYASLDPSFRMAREVLGGGSDQEAASFYAYLRANSTLQDTGIRPVSIDFANAWTPPADPPPHVFVLIVDSLRPDYLSPYNTHVTFTPAIDRFAADSFVFRRAFTRYGGTGLAVPSIWAGSMLIHRQYVTPFAPTNALEKLMDAGSYRRYISDDHIADELFEPSPRTVALDRNVPEMLHTLCRTLPELDRDLAAGPITSPVFALTRPLDLHIGNIASATVPPGESYPDFYGPYAARVHRMDTCVGDFIESLKRLGLYDHSIIVLTSDHGDSLGEGQRWGHGVAIFPEVIRVPLIVHLPPALRARFSTDLTRLAFSTDLTPTLYALLGAPPAPTESRGVRDLLKGSPLFVAPEADLSWRERESYLVTSSYGPVYGLLSRNGRHLYIADAVEGREYAYDLGADGGDLRVGLTDAERSENRRLIRQQVDDLAAWYHFTPEP